MQFAENEESLRDDVNNVGNEIRELFDIFLKIEQVR
jgi:hypothetical protein